MQVSTVIEEGGDLINAAPERVVMGIMVRALTIDVMGDASHKIGRNMKATAMASGDKVGTHDYTSYLPPNTDRRIVRPYRDNMIAYKHAREGVFVEDWGTTGSTDLGDIPQIMPCMHVWASGIKGDPHTERYWVDDPYIAYIAPARMMALIITDLLRDGGARGKEIMGDFRPALTKEKYLNLLKDHQTVDLYDASDL